MKIGFVGLGIMGRPMAGHLQSAGHAIYSCANRTPMPNELREGGAIACSTPAAVA
jgi:2-hydroxy-3-oxopropionate reductase